MISTHVEDIIVAIKANPNGLWRNKALSHAHDLYSALTMMELEIYPGDKNKKLTAPQNAPNERSLADVLPERPIGCTCPAGSFKFDCPIHGGK